MPEYFHLEVSVDLDDFPFGLATINECVAMYMESMDFAANGVAEIRLEPLYPLTGRFAYQERGFWGGVRNWLIILTN